MHQESHPLPRGIWPLVLQVLSCTLIGSNAWRHRNDWPAWEIAVFFAMPVLLLCMLPSILKRRLHDIEWSPAELKVSQKGKPVLSGRWKEELIVTEDLCHYIITPRKWGLSVTLAKSNCSAPLAALLTAELRTED